ncbi:MAG: DNA polymerase I [Muribaculaceae bacterium]|nr:DNA polymerase I [Muribaculaceae bacterium]
MEQKRLFLLDAYALIFRAYYALIKMPRITQAGFNTSAIFGFVNTLEEILRKENPTHIAVCFDPQGPTFRNEAYDEYKAERSATPEDIKLSVPIIKEIVKAYSIPVVEVEGFEADDVIGTLAKRAEKEGFTTYMMTPDKDYGQLVSPSVLQYKPSYRGQDFELRGEEEVCARYDIEKPSQVIDLLALMGDKIDNIPGCPGVGEKTAVKLIKEFGSVENLIANTDSLKGALKKKIEENKEKIEFSKFLATIRTDVPVDIRPDDLSRHPADKEKLFAIFKDLEFRTLIDRVGRRLKAEEGVPGFWESIPLSERKDKNPESAPSLFDEEDFNTATENATGQEAYLPPSSYDAAKEIYALCDTPDKLDEFSEKLFSKKECGIFLLADGENDATSAWIGTAIAREQGKAVYIPASFEEGNAFVLDLLARPDITKVSGNTKRDYVVASRRRTDSDPGVQNYYDVSLAHYILQPEMRHGISDLAAQYLNYLPLPLPQPASGAKKSAKTFVAAKIDTDTLLPWACEQADLALRLRAPLEKLLEKESEEMRKLLYDVEFPLVKVLAEMELTGVRIDVDALNDAARDMEHRISELESEIHQLAGEEFNVGSPAKVGEILFDKLQLDPKAKKTKTGQYSTSEDILEKIAPKHPIVEKIIKYRALKKLLTTYLTALPANINPETGKVHTNYNQTVTATGRISSSAPNLQNIPVRDDEGREIRRAFIADPGHIFLSADYSQIELRLVADFADDEIMLDAFRHNKDIHAITAAKIYHKDQEEVTANERRNAKTANFGILYGISAFGLASRLSIPRAEAKELIDNYFATFPTIHKYMSDSVEAAREQGYVTTRMGRKRMLPDINSRNPVVRGYAERNAVNAPIQGSAADIIKVAMVNIAREMDQKGMKSKMIMQVHDELNFDVVPEELPQMQEMVERLMPDAYHGRVTLTASCGAGSNWLDAH